MRYGDSYNDGKISEENVAAFVNARRQVGIDAYGRYWAKTRQWYSAFRGVVSNPGNHRNDMHIPILFAQCMSDVTNKAQQLFADQDIVQFVPGDPAQEPEARKTSTLVNMQLWDSSVYTKAVDLFLSGSIYGSGFARTTWRLEQHPRLYRTRVLDQEMVVRDMQTTFDGPDFQVVDILDIIPEPNKTRLEDCDWIIHTYSLDLDNLLEMAYQEGVPMFEPEAIKRLIDSPMDTATTDSWKLRQTVYRNFTDINARQSMSRPVEITEYWGKVPSEFAINGDRNVVITVANGKVVLRYEPNPFWHGRLPFILYTPMPDLHALHGTGKCEIGAKMQAAINKLASIKLDALEIFAQPQFFVSNTSGLDTQQLVSRPGKLFPVQGEDIGKAVMPVSPDITALQTLYTEISEMSRFAQQGTGVPDDVVQGIQAADRETARGFLSRKESAMGRLAGEARLAEEMFIVPLAQTYHENNKQWLTLPKQIKMLGMEAIVDPVTGMPTQQQAEFISLSDIRPDYKCRAVGTSRLMSKANLAQQLTNYASMAATNPAMLAVTNWVNFVKVYTKALNLNANDLLIQQITGGGVPLLNQVATGGGGAGDQINSMMGLPGAGPAGNTPYLEGNSDTFQSDRGAA